MIGKSYNVGRHVQRYTGGGGSMKPTNFSEAILGMIVLGVVFFMLASCVAPFV